MAGFKNWREVRGERALNERRVEAFRQLMESQQLIAQALEPFGLTDALLDAALAAAEPALPEDEHDDRDFYLPALELYTAALGGRLEFSAAELRAVFPRVMVTIHRPADPTATPRS